MGDEKELIEAFKRLYPEAYKSLEESLKENLKRKIISEIWEKINNSEFKNYELLMMQ